MSENLGRNRSYARRMSEEADDRFLVTAITYCHVSEFRDRAVAKAFLEATRARSALAVANRAPVRPAQFSTPIPWWRHPIQFLRAYIEWRDAQRELNRWRVTRPELFRGMRAR